MFLNHVPSTIRHHRMSSIRQRGFAIISALFILVSLAMLGSFIVNLSTMQHIGSALDLKGAQAYQAAGAGIEVGLAAASTGVCPANTSFAVDTMMVTLQCTSLPVDEAGVTASIYALTSTACSSATTCPGDVTNPNYVERRVTVAAEF